VKAKVAKKLVSSLAVSSVLVSVFAACDLGLTPYVAPNDSGIDTLVDTGTVDTGATVVDAGSDAADASDGATGPRVVFVTSTTTAGTFVGQAGADRLCQTAATQAKLPGQFVAWISELQPSRPAIDHIPDVGPWYLADRRTLVFASKASITAFPLVQIDMDETGKTLVVSGQDPGNVWTGTQSDGRPNGSPVTTTCFDWTQGLDHAYVGSAKSNTMTWTQLQSLDTCTNLNHLYCFQQ
jgi:hypothetical protein